MNKKAFVIVGLGFGDEGKGLATDYLCFQSNNPIVIRFNGGHQAGHTVVTNEGLVHIFSNFGSGTLRGVPTYWSKYCTFSPVHFLEEYKSLKVVPKLLLDLSCLVTTHYDVLYNRAIEITRGVNKHGSCGVGFGATIERSLDYSLRLKVKDLLDTSNYSKKLALIRAYYEKKINNQTRFSFGDFDHDSEDLNFKNYIIKIEKLISKGIINIVNEEEVFSDEQNWQTYIFEGAQGVLLDINFGVYPYVTKSNTTSKNAIAILQRNFTKFNIDIEVFYITRAYQTRHGAGPFNRYDSVLQLRNTEAETNTYNLYQDDFKINLLDIDQLNYAIKCDENFSNGIKKNLLITCLDQLDKSKIPVYNNGTEIIIDYMNIPKLLECEFNKIKFSFSSKSEELL